jgi:acylphosphatase
LAEKRLQGFAFGEVQGVGFRMFVQMAARKLELNGFVRNIGDGSVEVIAEGDEHKLNRLAMLLRDGPPAAEVESFQVRWMPSKKEFSGFDIRY